MPVIRQLPASLVNKIAAGEVIERPASVVKELLENAIDAGATGIELAIEGGGIEMIRVSDSGCGIAADQIPMAIASHATSKLETADDLFDVHTLGFRGEALASIAEVSQLTLKSRTSESDAGYEMQVRGGEASPVTPVGCPVGTTIEVRQLFFNTPVRRKFLRTPQTEAGHISEAFTRIALAFPQVRMTMTSGHRTQYDLPATDSWKERIRAFFGDEIADSLIAVDSEQQTARLSGYVADPSISRANNRLQYLFLNGRHIRDRSLQHALGESYRGLLMVGRFPVCFLRLAIPPDQVDVNVHPTKMEVRFQEGGKLYSQLLQTLRHQFLTSDLTARTRHVPGPAPRHTTGPGNQTAGAPSSAQGLSGERQQPLGHDEQRWQTHAESVTRVDAQPPQLDFGKSVPEFRPFSSSLGSATVDAGAMQGLPPVPQPPSAADPSAANRASRTIDQAPVDSSTAGQTGQPGVMPAGTALPEGAQAWEELRPDAGPKAATTDSPETTARSTAGSQPTNAEAGQGQAEAAAGQGYSHLGYQVHDRYLITQDQDGMVVVDQHALHERILYEQLRQKAETRSVESQQLLVPEPLDLTAAEAAAALDHRQMLEKIGIQVEPFGGDTVLMTSYPAMLANMRPVEVLRQVLEPLMAGGPEPSARDVLDELLHMIACKAAIKAGDRLSSDEITSLLEQRYHFQDTHHCPHGRPTALHFSREQLDKMFKRT